MYHKLLSTISRSPALAEELNRYNDKLKTEVKTRKVGLVLSFMILPFLAYFMYTQSTPAIYTSSRDLLSNASTKQDVLNAFDANTNDFRTIVSSIGINKKDLSEMKESSWNASSKTLLWNKIPYGVTEKQYNLNHDDLSLYSRPSVFVMSQYESINGWSGISSKIGWFAIAAHSGNIFTSAINPLLALAGSDSIQYTSTTSNTSRQGQETIAIAGDIIQYTLSAYNTSSTVQTAKFSINLEDILEYANPTLDLGGGSYSSSYKTISWPEVDIAPNSSEVRIFSVRIKDPLSEMSQPKLNTLSQNCQLNAFFGNATQLDIKCSQIKQIELTLNQMPPINPIFGILALVSFILLASILYYRVKLRLAEIAVIKHEMHTGPY